MKRSNPVTLRNSILYLRYSTLEQSEGQSELRQTQMAQRWSKENDAELAKIYKDLGISGGKSADDRKGIRDLLADLKRGGAPQFCGSSWVMNASGIPSWCRCGPSTRGWIRLP